MAMFARRFGVAALVAMGLLLILAVPAFAGASMTEKQVDPGVTMRTIWNQSQVGIWAVENVSHNGYIHMEVTFKPNWGDVDIYLLNKYGEAVGGIGGEQGYLADFLGTENVDFKVTNIIDKTVVDPDATPDSGDEYIQGDTYYVLIVAFNEPVQYQVKGYYPMTDLTAGAGSSTTNAFNYYRDRYRHPADKDAWAKIAGPIYGGPYDFKPTSEGDMSVMLQWPANLETKTVDYSASTAWGANMESYMYSGADWNGVWSDYSDTNWFLDSPTLTHDAGLATEWHGLLDSATLDEAVEGFEPNVTMHFVPSLYCVANDPATGQGPFADPPVKVGKTTVGFKATVSYPQNLRFTSVPKSVMSGATATLKGTFALAGAWKAGAEVTIQKMSGGHWVNVNSGTTNASGVFSIKVKITKTLKWRAKAAGEAPGLAVETTVAKQIIAK